MDAGDGDGSLRLLMRRHAELLATELEPKYPEFTRDLKQAVHDTHWRQETQCARALIALQRRDGEIDALRRELERKAGTEAVANTRAVAVQCETIRWPEDAAVIAEQRDQIDVLLDELENLRAALDAQHRMTPQVMDEGVQTMAIIHPAEAAMSGMPEVRKNLSVMTETAIPKSTFAAEPALDECPWASAVASLQHACAFMQLSSTCSVNISIISALEASECVDLEHRLQAQAMELNQMRRCFDQFREHAAALMMNAQDPQSWTRSLALNSSDPAKEITSESTSSIDCASVLDRIITQLMERSFSSAHSQQVTDNQWRLLLEEISKNANRDLEDGYSAHAAVMIQQWAGWETEHAHEIQAIRQSCANQVAWSQHRINTLVATVHQSNQREIDLQAEVNVLKRILDKRSTNEASASLINPKANANASAESRRSSYTDLLLEATHLQHKLHEQTERLSIAESAVRALSSTNPAGLQPTVCSDSIDLMNNDFVRLTCELQSTKQALSEAHQHNEDLLLLSSHNNALESEILSLRQQLAAEHVSRRSITAERDVCKKALTELDRKRSHLKMRLMTHDATQSCTIENRSQAPDVPGDYDVQLYQARLLEKDRQQLLDRLVRVQTHALVLEQELHDCEYNAVVSGVNQILGRATKVFGRVSDYYEGVVSRIPDLDSVTKVVYEEIGQPSNSIFRGKALENSSRGVYLMESSESREIELKHALSAIMRASDAIWYSFQHLHSFICDLVPSSLNKEAPLSTDQLVDAITQCLHVSRHENSWLSQSIELQKHQEKQYLLQRQLIDKEQQLHAQSQCLLRAGISLNYIPAISTTAEVAVQTSLKHKKQRSRAVQTVPLEVSLVEGMDCQVCVGATAGFPMPSEVKPLQQPTVNAPCDFITTSKHVGNVQTEPDIMQELRNTQQELERSVARISALTEQNEELAQRLRRANKATQKYSKDCKDLLSQLTTSASTNALLSGELSRRHQVADPAARPADEVASSSEMHEQVSALMNDLASREQENLSLVQSLMEMQAKYSKSEESRSELEAKARELQSQLSKAAHDKDVAHVSTLESYMKRVEASLADLEQEKNRLESENQTLRAKLEHSMKSVRSLVPTTSKSTETENASAWESDRSLQERQELQDQITSLNAQVKYEQRRFEELDSAVKKKHAQDVEQEQRAFNALEQEQLRQEEWMNELRWHHRHMQQEFAEYQSACNEAQEECKARVAFLTACLEECSRLVDTPTNQDVTTRDLHDAIVSISQTVVSYKAHPAAKKQRGVKSAPASAKLAVLEKSRINDATTPAEIDMSDGTVLALDAWKIRAAKLEQQLLASRLKMQTFEDRTERVEAQMKDVKLELKDRMAKEALLLTKNAALKSEIATLKTQQGSISVQYSQAFESLKLNQMQLTQKDEELSRLRLAMQRKSELLTRHKDKTETLQKELESTQSRLTSLVGVEQRFIGFQQKTKEQSQQFQDLKRQCAIHQEQQVQLTTQLEREQAQYGALQARYKAARSENAHLRSHIADLKMKWKADGAIQESEAHQALQIKSGSSDEVKSLKRRMLQKQEVIGNYKIKLADLEQQMETQRSKIVELAHANRLLSQEQRTIAARAEKEVSDVQNDLESQLVLRSARLDGLRASVYDSFEAFVHCTRDSSPMSPTSSSSSSSFTASMVSDVHELDHNMTDLQRWTELSTHDLLELDVHQKRQRTRNPPVAPPQRKIQGRRALRSLETALEESPEDCRPEICRLLDILCAWKSAARSH